MSDADDAARAAAIWKSETQIRDYLADMELRERARRPQWEFMALLLPFDDDASFTFADLGAGPGGAARAILDRYPASHAVLADFSPLMKQESAAVMQPYAGRFDYVEFDMAVGGPWPDAIPPELDAVITSQCVHHLPDERKQGLFAEIWQRLTPGGWYLNLDPVSSADPLVDETWLRVTERIDPAQKEKRLHRTSEQHQRHEDHIRHMLPLDEQVDLVRAAGFEAVDVSMKKLDYAIYGGRRPA
jgi:SAM-dependent methyltransferase